MKKMNFKEFYINTENRLIDSAISLWATGDAEMQEYFKAVLAREPLLAEPVIQTAFPWEPASINFEQCNNIFCADFIKALSNVKNEDFRFPLNRYPYKHQIKSWDTLINKKKSIAVTTGTGSGKTECFMLPVIYDIFKNSRNSIGVNAIFLYPLNALIGSQKKRIDEWCNALGGIKYAVYNRNTPESIPQNQINNATAELVSRNQIRSTPPNILFTNPSMLEYMLVRNKDVKLLEQSQGKLRWILLDEAHKLTGSLATEMALLIRRIIDAFGANISELRFAITSATVGGGDENEVKLKSFMSNLCGINEDNIIVISGSRVFSQKLPSSTSTINNPNDILHSANAENFEEVHKLRADILEKPALQLSDIGARFKLPSDIPKQLEIIDILSNIKYNNQSILPVRGHFFTRGIGGVFVCTNSQCNVYNEQLPRNAMGHFTTISSKICKCGGNLLELVACSSCGNHLLESERLITSNGDEKIQMITTLTQDPFDIESSKEDEDADGQVTGNFYFGKYIPNRIYTQNTAKFTIDENGLITRKGDQFVEANSGTDCPYCGNNMVNPFHFRLSASFINRAIADIILETVPEANILKSTMLWKGRKYISFTDSRQGTAKISALINQDNEAAWIRSEVYHLLCKRMQDWKNDNPQQDLEELKLGIEALELELKNTTMPLLRRAKEKQITDYKNQLEVGNIPPDNKVTVDWTTIINELSRASELTTIYKEHNPNDDVNKKRYLTAVLYDQFARRLLRERSLENLGMVNLYYPDIESVNVIPQSAYILEINLKEWHDLLKIAADYIIRFPNHLSIDLSLNAFSAKTLRSYPIYPYDSQVVNVKRWPKFKRNQNPQNRLALLICAGLGYTDKSQIDNAIEDQINELMSDLWVVLRNRLLVLDGNQGGYKLNLEDKTKFKLADTLWLCPVQKRLIDAQFRGYSPWIKGSLTEENIRHYKITEPVVKFPEFPFPFNTNANNQQDTERTRKWIKDSSQLLRKSGLWNNLHEQVLLKRPLFLSGEHSAQQNQNRLKELESKFENGEINILNCSTTMEMGVDIGGVSAVVMNNVPPRPANYLQRAGRAGRRSEPQSLAFTICVSNPVGLNVFYNPLWAFKHEIAPPLLSFNSKQVIERHINAFFLGKFVQTDEVKGINIKGNIDKFFFNDQANPLALVFATWLQNNQSIDIAGLKSLLNGTSLASNNFDFLRKITIEHFEKLNTKTSLKKEGFDSLLLRMSEFGQDSPAYKTISFQKNQFLQKNAISYLAEQGFLPNAGLPVGIVEFDTYNIEDLRANRQEKSKPSFNLTRALSEYAPGSQVVIDGKCHVSAGIILESDRGNQATREVIQSCTNCGYQRIVETAINDDGINANCQHCGQNTLRGLRFKDGNMGAFTEMIQPAGFAVDLFETPTREINNAKSAYYVDPLLINIKPWQNESAALFDVRESEENAEILYYNVGNGNGYAVCLHCGRTGNDKTQLNGHRRLRGGKNNDALPYCSGNEAPFALHENVILGGRFKTDFCEVRFRNDTNQYSNDDTLLYSLGTVLSKELAHYLGIEEAELGFGIKRYDGYKTVFIYDTAKGGAGYASQFILHAEKVFDLAIKQLEKCNCNIACTKCMIDRNTQWHLVDLNRILALEWLNRVIRTEIPIQIAANYQNISQVLGSVRDEIIRYSYFNQIKEIRLYGNSKIQDWNVEKLLFIEKLKSYSKPSFVINKINSILSLEDKISIIQLSSWATISTPLNKNNGILKTICKIRLEDDKVIEYLASDFNSNFNESWGNSTDGLTYKYSGSIFEPLELINIDLSEGNVFEAIIDTSNAIPSFNLADCLLEKLQGKVDLEALMSSQNFQITYSDRYLKTPLGCLMAVQFIKCLSQSCNFKIDSFCFKGQEFTEERDPKLIFHNYKDSKMRNKELIKLANQLDIHNVMATDEVIPHFRFFEFTNEKLQIVIRPDAGVEHGWFSNSSNNRYNEGELNSKNSVEIRKKDNNALLYTVSIEKL